MNTQKLKINQENIKYVIKNTPLCVIITKEDKICFELTEKMEQDLKEKNPHTMHEYTEKVAVCIQYLLEEGFIEKNPFENNDFV
jgi:hypothetical protein